MQLEKFARWIFAAGVGLVALGMSSCATTNLQYPSHAMVPPDVRQAIRQAEIDRERAEAERLAREDLNRSLSEIKAPEIVVDKSERTLQVLDGNKVVRRYRVGLGGKPEGDKVKKGDSKTPEGQFYIVRKNPGSRFHKSLWISYPSPDHARKGLERGIIDKDDYSRIAEAYKKKQQPPQNTPLGGAVCLHGGGGRLDWTEGCVALSNKDMDELYRMIRLGAPVTILP